VKPGPLLLLAVLCLGLPAGAAANTVLTPSDSTAMDWSRVPEYRIVPGDKLELDFGHRPDGPSDLREARVRPDGRISVFPAGDVIAAGLTPMELQRNIIALLSADLKLPRVVVNVVEVAGNVVHVMGRVDKPGSYPAGPFVTVMQAITAAGGLKEDAARNSVLLFHRDGARTVAISRIRLDRLMKGDDLADAVVGRFDIVFVPRSTIGNLSVFTQQLLSPAGSLLSSSLVGWELFNLDRVFVTRVIRE
jgi:protein involved in polysaccharide export with SLBB domain